MKKKKIYAEAITSLHFHLIFKSSYNCLNKVTVRLFIKEKSCLVDKKAILIEINGMKKVNLALI